MVTRARTTFRSSFASLASLACLAVASWLVAAPALAAEKPPAPAPAAVPKWQRFEAAFTSDKERDNPLQQVELAVNFKAPSGAVHTVDGFWDGGTTYRVRFAPPEEGAWTYTTRASDDKDAGLHARTGSFTARAHGTATALDTHGPLQVSGDRRYLQHADGTPFFWLADTAWAGPLMSTEADWAKFLRDRRAKRFNVMQVMATQNIAAGGDMHGRQAFNGRQKILIDPVFWQRLDKRFDATNAAGLVMAPSFSWAAAWAPAGAELDPGHILPETELIKLLRYAHARYGAHHVAWLFGGDIDYSGAAAEKWKRVGRAAFGPKPRHVVTMHPAPKKLHFVDFKGEPWLGFLGYQSSHASSESTHRYMTEGEPATTWKQEPIYPIINIEPNYEAHFDFHEKNLMDAFDVRRASYWSVLCAPAAGVTYGAHGVWSWEPTPALPMSHPKTAVAQPWHVAMALPGSRHMKVLYDVFDGGKRPWWRLRPVPEKVVVQPGKAKTEHGRFVAAAAAEDGSLFIAYFPTAAKATLDLAGVPAGAKATWVDPTTGRARPAAVKGGERVELTPPGKNAGGDEDFVLVVEAAAKRPG